MLIPGLVSATLKGTNYKDVLNILKENKLYSIEWSENHHVPIDDKKLVKEIGERTREEGVTIASYGSYYRLGEKMEFNTHLENAILLGSNKIRVWAGTKPSEEVNESEYEELVKEAKEITKSAEREGIKVCLEWHKNTLTDTNESGFRFLNDVNSPYFKTFWQPTAALSISERNQGLALISQYLENLHVYYWDQTGRRPLFEGKEIWKGYLSNLDIKNNDYFALLEFVKDNSVEQLKEDAKVLHQIIGEL